MMVDQRGKDWRIALYLLIEGYWSDYKLQHNKKKQFVKKEQA